MTSRPADPLLPGRDGGGAQPDTGALRETPSFRLPSYPVIPLPVFIEFLAFVFTRYVQLTARRGFLAAIRFEFILGGIAVAMAIGMLSNRRPDIGNTRNLLIAIALLFVMMIVQLPLAADPVVARITFNDRVFKFAMLTFLMVVFLASPHYLRMFLAVFLCSIFYITLESTQGLISGGLYWQNQGVMRLHGAVPIYGHPNSLGGVSLGCIPFIWYFWDQTPKWWLRAALLVFATTAMICVIYSGSRTAYVGLIGFAVWIFIQSERKWRFLVRAAVVITLAVMVLPDQYIDRFKSIGGKEKEGHSKEARVVILQDAWTIFQENPLGVGVASFPAKRMERFGRLQDTHNLYLEVATNLGIQGFLVFCMLLWTMMSAFNRSRRGFQRMRKRLRQACTGIDLSKAQIRAARVVDKDLRFCIATARAGGGFIFIRMSLGMFGMDLYEIYWWFGAGLAIVLGGLAVHANKLVVCFEELRSQP